MRNLRPSAGLRCQFVASMVIAVSLLLPNPFLSASAHSQDQRCPYQQNAAGLEKALAEADTYCLALIGPEIVAGLTIEHFRALEFQVLISTVAIALNEVRRTEELIEFTDYALKRTISATNGESPFIIVYNIEKAINFLNNGDNIAAKNLLEKWLFLLPE